MHIIHAFISVFLITCDHKKTTYMKIFSFLYINLILSFISFSQNYSRVKLTGSKEDIARLGEFGVAVDHGISKGDSLFISDFSKEEIAILETNNVKIEILIPDLEKYYYQILNSKIDTSNNLEKNASCGQNGSAGNPSLTTPKNFNLGGMGGYLKYSEMLLELDEMATLYPNLIQSKKNISNFVTFENRPIYYIKISDNPAMDEQDEPKILYTAIHHAREPMSMMETIFFMWYLLENYGKNEEITYLIDRTQLYFVPCLNPDGYVYNETTNPNGGGMWRKNRRNNGNGTYGVDLNRNYAYGWGTTGTSNVTSNETYCGTAPFSEPETQAMRWLVENNKFDFAFNAHTYGNDILFPIGTTTAEFADHHVYFQEHTNHMVEKNGYGAMKSSGLYPASGDSDDFMYKLDIGIGQKDTIFAHTPEVGTAFWQPQTEIISTCKGMVVPNLILAHLAKNYAVVKDTDPSNISQLTGDFNHSIKRYGREAGSVTVSIQPLLNILSVGNPITYNLSLSEARNGSISYVLNPNIQFGNEVKFVLLTDNGMWVKRDTITKIFGDFTLLFSEDANTSANWTGSWSTTNTTFVSPSKSFYDGSIGNYSNNTNKTFQYNTNVDLTNSSAASVSFYAKWDLETDYDFVQFQVSTDGGVNWIGQCGKFTSVGISGGVQPVGQPIYEGTMPNWVLEEIDLSEYLGKIIKLRFQLRSDGGTTADGFYFDDFKLLFKNKVTPATPKAYFFVSENSICKGNSITFADNTSNFPNQWYWNFGDGITSSLQNPSHIFFSAGIFDVTLIASNNLGSDTISQQIIVNDCASVEMLKENEISIYPNPNGGSFKLKGFDLNSTFFITDFNGKLLFLGTALNDVQFTIPEISAGLYYLNGISNGYPVQFKIIVNQKSPPK